MKHKIKTKYFMRMMIFLVVVIGAMILIYSFFSEDFYMYSTKNNIEDYFETVKTMNLEKLSSNEQKSLDDIVSQGFIVNIFDGTRMIYASGKGNLYGNNEKNFFNHDINEYQYNAEASTQNDRIILLKGKTRQKNIDYYVRIGMSIRSLDSSESISSRFLLIEMSVIIILGIFYSIYLANKTLKPIEKLDNITKLMMENNYVKTEDDTFDDDEIGQLAERIQSMYVQITDNLIEEKNYNYLLTMQNAALAEMDIRKRNFIKTATHELKTPLAIISSQVEMMNIEHANEISEYYVSITEEIEKMSVLIREMLSSSFKEKLKLGIRLKKQNLSAIIDNQRDKYILWMKHKKLTCHFEIEPDVYILMNHELIEQALNNFMMNAFEHAKPDSTIEISLKCLDGFAYLSVQNQGDKIPENSIERIWERFYSSKQNDDNSNAGLGLYIVYDIVKYHDGECFAENTTDGVKFTIKLKIEDW